MTRYTVTWRQEALNLLTRIWTNAPDRRAVAAAADAIDAELAANADRKGTAFPGGFRTFHLPPLHVLFAVSEPDRLVNVMSVRTDEVRLPDTRTNGAAPPAEGSS